MSLVLIVVVLAVVGVLVWAVVTYVPMPPAFRTLIIAITAIASVVWVLQSSGLLHLAGRVRV